MFMVLYLISGKYLEVFETESQDEFHRVFEFCASRLERLQPFIVTDNRKEGGLVGASRQPSP